MTKIILVTESGSDLPQKYRDQYGIYVVPMHVIMGDKTYDDGINVEAKDVFEYYDKQKKLPSTSGSTPEDFSQVFDEIFQKHPDSEIVYIAYSSVTTVSYNSARIAAEAYSNIHLVDSKNVSSGLASIVIAAARYIEANPLAKSQEVVDFVNQLVNRTHFHFLPQTLTYLLAGGRVSNAQYLGAKLLRLFPSIKLDNGYLIAGKKYRGSFQKAYVKMIDDFFADLNPNLDSIILTEVEGLSASDKIAIENKVKEKGVEEVEWIKTGAVIACHGGPGAFGIVGVEKE